jgi:hypothetical protein
MQYDKLHYSLRLFTLLTVVALMMPIAIKTTFIFEEHHHDICIDNLTDSHFHTKDLHCELYKFTSFTHYLNIENKDEINSVAYTTETINYNYNFLKNHRPLSFSLRGPPSLN